MQELKATLVDKIQLQSDRATRVILLKREDGVITIGDDRTIKIWMKRDTGQFWPSVCHALNAIPLSMDFNHETRRLFVGTETGLIIEFEVAEDFNSLNHCRDYYAHNGGVSGLVFCLSAEWVLSVGRDKCLVWHCSETGKRLGSYTVGAWCTSLQFDSAAHYAFIGDYSGAITVVRILENDSAFVSKFCAHSGSVRALAWDPTSQLLFSGSYDQSIIIWDIGGKKGSAFELHGHQNKVVSLTFASGPRRLISASDDGRVVAWDMNVHREETPEWRSSNNCEQCDLPFFWNVKAMWSRRIVGLRQHHCRACGRAVCDPCSQGRTCIPSMGHEYPVRVCGPCATELSTKDLKSLAMILDTKHLILDTYLDETQGKLLTTGTDKALKIWNISSVLR
jgi:WD40 repeat protein